MKIEVTPAQTAAAYVGKAVILLDTACKVMGDSCNGCPLKNPDLLSRKCLLHVIKENL